MAVLRRWLALVLLTCVGVCVGFCTDAGSAMGRLALIQDDDPSVSAWLDWGDAPGREPAERHERVEASSTKKIEPTGMSRRVPGRAGARPALVIGREYIGTFVERVPGCHSRFVIERPRSRGPPVV